MRVGVNGQHDPNPPVMPAYQMIHVISACIVLFMIISQEVVKRGSNGETKDSFGAQFPDDIVK